ncbi:MAG: hypothetical protein U0838_06745 [Chloroflexota bacterium]
MRKPKAYGRSGLKKYGVDDHDAVSQKSTDSAAPDQAGEPEGQPGQQFEADRQLREGDQRLIGMAIGMVALMSGASGEEVRVAVHLRGHVHRVAVREEVRAGELVDARTGT